MNTTLIDSTQDGKRLSTRELLDLIYEKIELGFNEFKIIASGQHDIGGPLWTKDGRPLVFHVTNPGQRVGSMGMEGTKIIVHGCAPADVGWLNSGAEIVVLGDGGDTTAHCCAGGKIYVAGRTGTRSGALMKHDPKFKEPEFWVLKSTGSFSFEFMGGGRAVICGYECDDMESVLGNRSCCGMVGGIVYVRGNVSGLTQDVDIFELNEEDKSFLSQGLKKFLNEIDKEQIYDELTDFSKWKKILPKPYGEIKDASKISICDFRKTKWVKDGIFSEFFNGDYEVIDVINNGNYRLRTPSWDNNQKTAPCEFDCPISIPTQKRLSLLREGKKGAALNLIYEYSPFPASVCGQVCPNLCMDYCSRKRVDEHIKIAPLGIASFENIDIGEFKNTIDKTIAVIGAGAAGLSAAWNLLRLGYRVEVFESDEEIGGKLRQVIPPERLDQDMLNIELEIIKNSGMKIHTSYKVDNDEFDRLRDDYDALVVAIGAHNPFVLPIEGSELLVKGLDFLKEVNKGNLPDVGDNVVVIGAGNAAMDVISAAYKAGAKHVSAIDIQKPAAFDKEIEYALSLGAKILYPCFSEKITKEGVYLKGGKFLKADTVIISIGDRAVFDFNDKKFLNEKKQPDINEFYQSRADDKVFFIGDDVKQGLFCNAIGQGRGAALNIHRMLAGKLMQKYESKAKISPCDIKDEYYKTYRSTELFKMDVLDEKDRCLSCGLCRDCKMCLNACPTGAIERVEYDDGSGNIIFAYVSDEKKCIGCSVCAGVCPCGVWTMKSSLE